MDKKEAITFRGFDRQFDANIAPTDLYAFFFYCFWEQGRGLSFFEDGSGTVKLRKVKE